MILPKYSRIVSALRSRIESGQLLPGTRLPGARRLADEFGVSAITSTRALDELERLGYVERRERSGTYVRASVRVLDLVVLLVSGGLDSGSTACVDYWRGASAAAERWRTAVRLMRVEDPVLPSLIASKEACPCGFIGVMTAPGAGIRSAIEGSGAPYLSLGIEDLHSPFSVTEDRRRACRALIQRMAADGCRRFGFLGNSRASNHVLAELAFVETARSVGCGDPVVVHADDDSAAAVAAGLLAAHAGVDALVIMGGHMPVAALPAVLGCGRPVSLGVMSENSTVLQLRSVAYVAHYSQEASGRLGFETLLRLARGELSGSATLYTPFDILVPTSR